MENRTEFREHREPITLSELEKCIVCGKEKIGRKRWNVKFCSSACYYTFGRPELKGTGGIERICIQCGKEFKVCPSRIKGVGGHQGKFCSKECYWANGKPTLRGIKRSKKFGDLISRLKSKDKEKCQSPIKLLIRESRKNEQWKKEVFARDNYTCQNCQEHTRDLVAHHIKPFAIIIDKLIVEKGIKNLYEKAMEYKPLWDIKNGITLCNKCHKKIPRFSRRAETKCSAPQVEDGAIVRTLQECKEPNRNALAISLN